MLAALHGCAGRARRRRRSATRSTCWSTTPARDRGAARRCSRSAASPRRASRAIDAHARGRLRAAHRRPTRRAERRPHEATPRSRRSRVKEMLQIWRDPRSLMIALLMPFMQMVAARLRRHSRLKHMPVCIFDREGARQSQALLKQFQASMYFEIAGNVRNYHAARDAIDAADCKIAVVIPPDFSQRLQQCTQRLGAGSSSMRPTTTRRTSRSAMRRRWSPSYSSEVVLDVVQPAGPSLQQTPADGGRTRGSGSTRTSRAATSSSPASSPSSWRWSARSSPR